MSELPSLVIQVVQGLRARNGRLCAAFLAILPSFSVYRVIRRARMAGA